MQRINMKPPRREKQILPYSDVKKVIKRLGVGEYNDCTAEELGTSVYTINEIIANRSKRSNRKLDIDQRVEIIQRLDNGETPESVASVFGVYRARITNIYRWKEMIMKNYHDRNPQKHSNTESSERIQNPVNWMPSNKFIPTDQSNTIIQCSSAGRLPSHLEFGTNEAAISKTVQATENPTNRKNSSIAISDFESSLCYWYIEQKKSQKTDKIIEAQNQNEIYRDPQNFKANYEHEMNLQRLTKKNANVRDALGNINKYGKHYIRRGLFNRGVLSRLLHRLMEAIEVDILSRFYDEVLVPII